MFLVVFRVLNTVFQHKYYLYLLSYLGGSVRGAQVLGQYPEDITSESPLTIGRGKFSC